jgi:hypothetical protein
MFAVGLFVGIALTISASAFAAGGVSEIKAYLREGFTFKVNGQKATLKNTPIVYNDTSYMPVRELAEMLGYDVGFEDNTITLNAKEPQATPAAERGKDVSDVTTTENETVWISLRDIAEINGLFVGQTSDSGDLFRVMKDNVVLFSIDYKSSPIKAFTPDGREVHIQYSERGTEIMKDDLIAFDLIQ